MQQGTTVDAAGHHCCSMAMLMQQGDLNAAGQFQQGNFNAAGQF